MIDLKFLRENPDIVKQNIKNKFQDSKLPLVDEVIELDKQSRAAKGEADSLRAGRNKISKQIGALIRLMIKNGYVEPMNNGLITWVRMTPKLLKNFSENSQKYIDKTLGL